MNEYRPSSLTVPVNSAPGEVVRNKVLRNTYWLLALSLIPTVLGAAVGLYRHQPRRGRQPRSVGHRLPGGAPSA